MLGVHPGNTTIAPDILRGCLLKYTRSVIASSISATSFLDAVRCLLVTLRSELGGGLVMVFFLFRERVRQCGQTRHPSWIRSHPAIALTLSWTVRHYQVTHYQVSLQHISLQTPILHSALQTPPQIRGEPLSARSLRTIVLMMSPPLW